MITMPPRIKTAYRTLLNATRAHRVRTGIIIVALMLGAYYTYGAFHSGTVATRYVLATAEQGTLVSSVTGSGQVSASNQVDLKPKVSGNVIAISATEGAQVHAGALLVQLDAQDAQKAVRDASANLQSTQLSLKKLTQPADDLSITQAENALSQATQSEKNAEDNLAKAYDDGFTSVANAFIDLPSVMTGLDNVLNGTSLNGTQSNAAAYYDLVKNQKQNADQIRDSATTSYLLARAAYDKTLQDYKNASRYADRVTIEALITESYNTVKTISDATKNTKTYLDLVNDALTVNGQNNKVPAVLTSAETNTQTYIGTTNTHLSDLLNITNSIKNDKDSIVTSNQTITEKTQSLAKLKNGPDPLDVQAQQLTVTQKENALRDAQEALANYYIRAPFDGVVAKIAVKVGDAASPSTAVATVITTQQVAEVTLNEVDVAKVKMGQKVTLTFDAFPDLTITGSVAEVDAIGTVTQGVVNYTVKITFDTQDDRIKPGMSTSAAIITNTKQDVLLVPSGAVKSAGGARYVELLDGTRADASAQSSQGITSPTPPRRQTVEIGTANDTQTEITSGLSQGDMVVVRTITATTASTATPTNTGGLRIPGLGGGGAGAVRTGGAAAGR
jgi:HlyD family secretion protein